MKTVAFALLYVAFAASAGAQQVDARWAPWLGCWQVTGGTANVCVTAAGTNSVTLTTQVPGEPDLAHAIVADASSHPIGELGCSGTQRAEWSSDGRRLFSRAELTCTNKASRTVSGLSLMTASDAWLDVQAIEISGQTTVRVRRYRRAAGEQARDGAIAPYVGSVAFTLESVKEAAAKVAPQVLEAALTETGARFALDSRALIDLDAARVPGPVIDVMVALSYPEKFQVERRPEANLDSYPPAYLNAEQAAFWGLGYPYYSLFQDYYGNYRYYSSPFGYVYPGSYGFYPGYYPAVRLPAEGGTATSQPSEDARVVNGVGYTRVRPREARKTDTATTAQTSRESSSGRSTAGSTGYTRGGSSGSSDASSTGSSTSGSGGSQDGGRTAQPR